MTTQARELAGIISNAGDLSFGDDLSLASDGAILNFGADSDVTLTHVADTGLLLNSTRRLQFGDSGTYIYQSADGVLDLVSDTEIELNATTLDINANVDISGTLTVAGALDFGDLDISNVGSIALDTITNDGTDITLDSSGDITLDADGGDIRFKDGGNTFGYVASNGADELVIGAGTADKDIIFKGTDGSTAITPLTIDMSDAGKAIFTASIHLDSDSTQLQFGDDNDMQIYHNGSHGTINVGTGNLGLDIAGDLSIDVDGGDIVFNDGGSEVGRFTNSSSDFVMKVGTSDKDLIFKGNDGGSVITALTLDMSDAGAATFNSSGSFGGNITLTSTDTGAGVGPIINTYRNSSSPADGDTLGIIRFTGRNDNSEDVVYANMFAETYDVSDGTEDGRFFIKTMVGGTDTHRMYMNFNETNFNEGSADIDFRVESNGDANMFFVDGGNDRVGIGTATPTRTLDINHASTAPDLRLGCDGNDAVMIILDADVSSADDAISHIVSRWNNTDASLITFHAGADTTNKDDGEISFSTRASGASLVEALRIDSAGQVGIGVDPGYKLHVKTTSGGGTWPVRVEASPDNDLLFGVYESSNGDGNNGMVYINDGAGNTDVKLSTNGNSWFKGGNLGIGDDSPITNLVVGGATNGRVGFHIFNTDSTGNSAYAQVNLGHEQNGFTGGYISHHYDGEMKVWNRDNEEINFATNNTQRMSLKNDGKLSLTKNIAGSMQATVLELWSINAQDQTDTQTTDIDFFLVDSNTNTGTPNARIGATGDATGNQDHEAGGRLSFYVTTQSLSSPALTKRGEFNAEEGGDFYTNDGSVSSLSDVRVKTNINNLTDGLNIVTQLRPVTYEYNNTTSGDIPGLGEKDGITRYGLIADEVKTVAPHYVKEGSGHVNGTLVDDFKSLSLQRMIPMLIKSIQELKTENDALKARVETLEG